MTFDLAQMIADREAGTPDNKWSLGDYPNQPVPMSGACISHYSRGVGGARGAANSSRFLRLPAVEAEVIRQHAEIIRLTARVEWLEGALGVISRRETYEFDSDLQCMVVVSMCEDEMSEIACAALSATTEEPKT